MSPLSNKKRILARRGTHRTFRRFSKANASEDAQLRSTGEIGLESQSKTPIASAVIPDAFENIDDTGVDGVQGGLSGDDFIIVTDSVVEPCDNISGSYGEYGLSDTVESDCENTKFMMPPALDYGRCLPCESNASSEYQVKSGSSSEKDDNVVYDEPERKYALEDGESNELDNGHEQDDIPYSPIDEDFITDDDIDDMFPESAENQPTARFFEQGKITYPVKSSQNNRRSVLPGIKEYEQLKEECDRENQHRVEPDELYDHSSISELEEDVVSQIDNVFPYKKKISEETDFAVNGRAFKAKAYSRKDMVDKVEYENVGSISDDFPISDYDKNDGFLNLYDNGTCDLLDGEGVPIRIGDEMAFPKCSDSIGEVIGLGRWCFFTIEESLLDEYDEPVVIKWDLDDDTIRAHYHHYRLDTVNDVVQDIYDESQSIEALVKRFRAALTTMRQEEHKEPDNDETPGRRKEYSSDEPRYDRTRRTREERSENRWENRAYEDRNTSRRRRSDRRDS